MVKETTQFTTRRNRKLGRFLKREEGASAIEYAVIAGLISVAIIAGAVTLGPQIKGLMDGVVEAMPATEE